MEGKSKSVSFNDNVKIHYMIVWSTAYYLARKSTWQQYAIDRARFQRRIRQLEPILNRVLQKKIKEMSLPINLYI